MAECVVPLADGSIDGTMDRKVGKQAQRYD